MKFEGGNIFSIDYSTQDELLALADKLLENTDFEVKLMSRMPPRRLLEHIDISKIDLFWLTERNTEYSMPPNLVSISNEINTLNTDGEQLIIIDGFEWLIDLHGKENILNFINDISDSLYGTKSRVIFPIDELSFDSVWVSRMRKVVRHIKLDHSVEFEEYQESIEPKLSTNTPDENMKFDLGIDGAPRLSILSRLPQMGFTQALLVKRILQWRRMGLDVSELEPALNYETNESYELYRLVEEKVRRVVELENYLYHNSDEIDASELSTALFRIKQLTGIEDLEKKYYSN
ncbi:MAG: DUF835 domain-containing protein [Euryarchaeota archaeon]|jgi:hypothetical protein|nr:DUF835 domain-containing protein [Euryarchaeota archaeon]